LTTEGTLQHSGGTILFGLKLFRDLLPSVFSLHSALEHAGRALFHLNAFENSDLEPLERLYDSSGAEQAHQRVHLVV